MKNAENRRWVLARRPQGDDFEGALEFVADGAIPDIADREILVRNLYISMDAGTRQWMSPREDAYQPPIPLGATMNGMVIGQVEDSKHPDFTSGDIVRGFGQWADYSVMPPDENFAEKVSDTDVPLPSQLALFGPNGWTGYYGIVETGQAKAGETVLVSAAAGATGSIAGQVAKIIGCRVIGLTSRKEKADWLTGELGFDHAINYREEDLDARLSALCPDGVDVFFDNVGGPILDTVMGHLALYARIAVCGLVAHYNSDERLPGPYNFDQLLMKRALIQGFFSPDFFDQCGDIESTLIGWYKAGKLKYGLQEVDGLENALRAYHQLFDGANMGKVMVKVASL